jgi:serine/threonine-protein kinase RsbW
LPAESPAADPAPLTTAACAEARRPLTSELSVTYRLRRHPSEISRAREQARKALTDWGLADHTDLAELIVSELATNALRHGTGPITVRLSYTANGDLWLEVHDHGRGRPVLQKTTADDEQGRGLALLEALTEIGGGILGTAEDSHALGKGVYVGVALEQVASELDDREHR